MGRDGNEQDVPGIRDDMSMDCRELVTNSTTAQGEFAKLMSIS